MKTIIIRTDQHKSHALRLVKKIPVGDTVYEVVIQEHDPGHSDGLHKLIWVRLTEIARKVPDENGELQSAEWWHYRLKLKFGLIADTMPLTLDSGMTVDVPIPKSLARSAKGNYRMTQSEASDYYSEIDVFAVEHGVIGEAG